MLGRRLLIVPSVGFLSLFFAYPLTKTLGAAFQSRATWEWAAGPYVQDRLAGALLQASLSVAATFALAVPLALLYHRRAIRWGRVHLAIHAAPFVLPVFVIVGGIRALFGPAGWTSHLGIDVLGVIGPMGAVVLAHAYYNYGFAARLLHAALDHRPRELEEAAAVLGAPPLAAAWRTTIRLLAPSIGSVMLLVFLFSFTSFGVVLLLGLGEVSTLETMLWQNLGGVVPRYGRAATLGVLQLVINVALLGGYFALRRRQVRLPRSRVHRPGTPSARDRVVAVSALLVGLTPAMAVLVGGFQVRGAWSMEPWQSLLDVAHPEHPYGFQLVPVIGRSLGYAAASAAVSLLLALTLAYGAPASARARRAFEGVASLPLGASSVLLGFGFLLSFGAGAALDLRGTRLIIVAAHALVGLPFVARVLLPAIRAHDARLDEAAQMLGAGPVGILTRIHAPLLARPLAAAAGFAVAMSLGDFGASLMLMRTDTLSLALWVHAVDAPFRPLAQAQSTALAGLLMVLAAGAYLVVELAAPKEDFAP